MEIERRERDPDTGEIVGEGFGWLVAEKEMFLIKFENIL